MATDAVADQNEEQATTELVTGAVGSRCANCQAPLANDQRYCLNCGARRGKARLPVTPMAAATPAAVTAEHRTRERPRMSSAATLVAGVATLLIAMGVGFLIGHDSAPATQKSAGVQIVTVGGGGSSSAANPSAPAQSTTPSAAGKASVKHRKTVVVHLTPKVQQKAAAAASKVFGTSGNGNLSSNPTQQLGQSCSGGAGCQSGKFTGNFFP